MSATMTLLRRMIPVALLLIITYAQAEKYPTDVTRLPAAQEPFVPGWSRLGIIDDDWYLTTRRHLSHITAIAPVVTMLSNLTAVPSASYSIHYQPQIPRSKIGKGVFKKGVFASDAPIPDCTPCAGAGGVGLGATTSVNSSASTSLPCSTIPYGVRSHHKFWSVADMYRVSSALLIRMLPIATASIPPTVVSSRRLQLSPTHSHAVRHAYPSTVQQLHHTVGSLLAP